MKSISLKALTRMVIALALSITPMFAASPFAGFFDLFSTEVYTQWVPALSLLGLLFCLFKLLFGDSHTNKGVYATVIIAIFAMNVAPRILSWLS